MSSEPIWPPPPDVPNPLAEHDAFLATLICTPATKLPMSRLRLTRELRLETGNDLRQCLAVVNNFCDRHSIFPPRRGLRLWLIFLPFLFQLGLVATWFVNRITQERNIVAAPTRVARHLLKGERLQWDYIFMGSMIVIALVSWFLVFMLRRQTWREDEQAKAQIAG